MARFNVPTEDEKPPVDPAALAAFAKGADTVIEHQAPTSATAPAPAARKKAAPAKVTPVSAAPIRQPGEPANRNLSLRLTDAQMELIDEVYAGSTAKSKQKMLEAILFPALEKMRKDMQSR